MSNWISVDYRLPPRLADSDRSDYYLVQDIDGEMLVAQYDYEDDSWIQIHNCQVTDIVAWRSLPEQYERSPLIKNTVLNIVKSSLEQHGYYVCYNDASDILHVYNLDDIEININLVIPDTTDEDELL
jgi:hypothetical protein